MNYLYVIKDLELRGGLKDRLVKYRKEGRSSREIADLLSVKGTKVGKSTVSVWVQHLESEGNK